MSKLKKLVGASTAIVAVMAATDSLAGSSNTTSTEESRPVLALYGDVTPVYGEISTFAGLINPFYGDIRPFYGDIRPFYGDIRPFWGDISAFWGDINPFYGDIRPFWGDIRPFAGDGVSPAWGDIGAFWGDIGAFWIETDALWATAGAYTPGSATYADLVGRLDEIVSRSEAVWGAAFTAKTGESFRDGFAAALFAKYGIDPNDPASLAGTSAEQRAHFMLAWYDGLMTYSGVDRVDHWMRAVNWTPAITQAQGGGGDAIIGLLDFSVAGDADVRDNIVWYGGTSDFSNGHGAAVAGLIVAAHDGEGVMGIAPQASVVAYNPFDSSGTANWDDVKKGILALNREGASVINMSLGVPGWTLHPDWNLVFSDRQVAKRTGDNTVFVMAAGNDGIAQTQDVAWNWSSDPNLIIVGSVDPAGQISSFSNRPGEACLLRKDKCASERDKLKYRFLVAPGELILVSDDAGGVTRRSGTSFAAPMVSGAIALLHDRWPWLADHPGATTKIIFESARDLGAPGVDPVYGWGMLDVKASQAWLKSSPLHYYVWADGSIKQYGAQDLQTLASNVENGVWSGQNAYLYMFERVDTTFRDYAIPLSAKLTSDSLQTWGGEELYQWYLQETLLDSITGSSGFAEESTFKLAGGWSFSARTTEAATPPDGRHRGAPARYAYRFTSPSGALAFDYGYGDGARALAGQTGFAALADYDPLKGGANPVLGFASGGLYAGMELKMAPRLALSAGVAHDGWNEAWREQQLSPLDRAALREIPYEASATNLGLRYTPVERVALTAGYTRLNEGNGLLGVQSLVPGDLDDGAATDALTLGAQVELPFGLRFAGSGTLARTGPQAPGSQNLRVTGDGVTASSWQVALTRRGVIGEADGLRMSFIQPLHVERGQLEHQTVKVVDRDTGELGVVDERVDLAGQPRALAAELVYVTPLFDGRGELDAFARAETSRAARGEGESLGGVRLKLRF